MEKKITISVITQGGELWSGSHWLWPVLSLYIYIYIFLSAQVVLREDTSRTIIDFHKVLWINFQKLLGGRTFMRQHFQRSRMSKSDLSSYNALSQVHLSVFLKQDVKLLGTNFAQNLMSPEEFVWCVVSPVILFFFSEKHLKISSWVTVIKTRCS